MGGWIEWGMGIVEKKREQKWINLNKKYLRLIFRRWQNDAAHIQLLFAYVYICSISISILKQTAFHRGHDHLINYANYFTFFFSWATKNDYEKEQQQQQQQRRVGKLKIEWGRA